MLTISNCTRLLWSRHENNFYWMSFHINIYPSVNLYLGQSTPSFFSCLEHLLPFQSGIWRLIWYLAFFILYLASGLWLQSGIWYPLYSICIWHPIWYLAAGIKTSLILIFQEEKALNTFTHIHLNNSWPILITLA